MKRLRMLALSAVLTVCAAFSVHAQETTTIVEPDWRSGLAMAGLVKVVIEDKLGGTAELVPGTNAVVFKGMGRGKGDIDCPLG